MKIQYFVINSLPISNTSECLKSFYETIPKKYKKITIKKIDELGTREKTLNHILKLRKKDHDIFIFVNDIRFLRGWFNSLNKNYKFGNIIGFSMIEKNGKKIQDFGYDFVKIDNELTTKAYLKGKNKSIKINKTFRECDAVCGCAMFLKSDTLNKIKEFPIDGNNRWGELIYSSLARKKGFKTIALSNHLIHYGNSTKQSKNPNKSSISWLYERENWKKIVNKYFKKENPVIKKNRIISNRLKNKIKNSKSILIYGCGTIADFLSVKISKKKKFLFVSSLKEEVGKLFNGKRVRDVNSINVTSWDFILGTPYEYKNEITQNLPEKIKKKIYWIKLKEMSKFLRFDYSKF